MDEFETERRQMVESSLKSAGFASHACWRPWSRCHAASSCREAGGVRPTEDRALPIAAGQTISQPYIVGLMTDLLALRGGEQVLEVGPVRAIKPYPGEAGRERVHDRI